MNMDADELVEWLGRDESAGAGWSKSDGSGETIGHERYGSWICQCKSSPDHDFSGRKIVEILKKNPKKEPEKYDEDDIPHMRKVVAYCKRHLAQEGTAKQNPDSKSAKSLKNWGHDPQKT